MEGIALVTLQAPVEITKDENGNCKSLITQPQMISAYRGSRPAPKDAAKEKQEIQSRCYYDRSWTGYCIRSI